MRWEYLIELDDDGSIRKRIFTSAQRLIKLRQQLPALAELKMELMPTDNVHVLGYTRSHEGSRLLVLANFSETTQTVSGNRLRTAGLGRFFRDRISETTFGTSTDPVLEPYGCLWLERA
jgi:amylosucrase